MNICVVLASAKILAKINQGVPRDHASFRSRCSFTDHINTLRFIVEQYAEFKLLHMLCIRREIPEEVIAIYQGEIESQRNSKPKAEFFPRYNVLRFVLAGGFGGIL